MAYAKFMVIFYVLFIPVYFGTRHLLPADAAPWQMFWEWETRIPFIAWMIWPYLTLYSVFCIPLFQASVAEIEALAKRTTFVLLVAGLCFLVFPGRTGFPSAADLGMHRAPFELLRAFDEPGNLVPSLHVTFSTLILCAAAQVATPTLRAVYVAWLCAMLVSVIAVHQHHVVDVAAGIALAAAAGSIFPVRSDADQATRMTAMARRLSMFIVTFVSMLMCVVTSSAALAQADTEAQARDRRELRALMVTLKTAMNEGRFQDMKKYLAKGYSLTMINQDNLTDEKSIDAFLETWFTGPSARIRRYRIEPEVSAPSILLDGKYAVAHGTAVETYGMDRGITYVFDSRWTATLAKEEGQWKVLAFHGGVSILDNPVLNAAERSLLYAALAGLGLGILGTSAAVILRGRHRRRKAAAA